MNVPYLLKFKSVIVVSLVMLLLFGANLLWEAYSNSTDSNEDSVNFESSLLTAEEIAELEANAVASSSDQTDNGADFELPVINTPTLTAEEIAELEANAVASST